MLQQFTLKSTNNKIDRLPMIELIQHKTRTNFHVPHEKFIFGTTQKNHSKIMLSKLFQDNILMEANINENIFVCLVDCVI